jgi:metallo-beta-lactamase family protein
MATVTSYGAAETVTGSCHLVTIGPVQILVDCGMFQGDGGSPKNYGPFGFDPARISFLILTHSHLDHIGRVAKLVKEGFRGEIISTKPTRDITKIMLLDSAKILEEEYKTLRKKARRRGEEASVAEPLYTEEHVEQLFQKTWHTLEYFERHKLRQQISVSLGNAGHIMGSAFVMIDYREEGTRKQLVFSGDLGSPHRLIIDSADTVEEADALFIESTYGDRNHKPLQESIDEFKAAVVTTLERGGNVLIPSFALERTQEVLWLLHEMFEEQELPQCRVFLDSPLAIRATELYNKYPIHLSEEVELQAFGGQNPFSFPYLELTPGREQSMAINSVEEQAIIIAGSGMCTGGRIMHHLKHRLWNPANSVIFVGFQAEGTLGRQLVEGADFVGIYGEEIIVRSEIHTINGFSAHADQADLIGWMRAIKRLERVCLVHGEPEKMEHFAGVIREMLQRDAHIMKYGIAVDI